MPVTPNPPPLQPLMPHMENPAAHHRGRTTTNAKGSAHHKGDQRLFPVLLGFVADLCHMAWAPSCWPKRQ